MQKFEFKYTRALLALCITAPLWLLMIWAFVTFDSILQNMNEVIIMAVFAAGVLLPLIMPLMLMKSKGFGILHKNHVEIHLKNKVHSIEYRKIKMVTFNSLSLSPFWRISFDDGSRPIKGHNLNGQMGSVIINTSLIRKKHDPLTIFMEALKKRVG